MNIKAALLTFLFFAGIPLLVWVGIVCMPYTLAVICVLAVAVLVWDVYSLIASYVTS